MSDRLFLEELLADTWRCLEAMVEPGSGFPRDTQRPGGLTNTTNIGLYLAALSAAREIGLVDEEEGLARATRILESLGRMERVRGFMPNFIPVDMSDRSAHGVMAASDFNKLAAGLLMTRQAWPVLTPRIDAFLDSIEWSVLYNPETGQTSWGYDLDHDQPVGEGQFWLAGDTRLVVFMLVATGAAPPELWERLSRFPMETEFGTILAPGYGFGALFMHAMDGLFLDERDTEVGASAGNLAWHQVHFAARRGYPFWGWSNCYIPGSGYTEGGYLPERVVTPYAVALALPYYPRRATRILREMVESGGSVPPQGTGDEPWGLRDAYNMDDKVWDERYLSLDQSMVFLALANTLHDGVVQRIYARDPLVRRGLALLEPHIERNPALLDRWAERDQPGKLGVYEEPASPLAVHEVALDGMESTHPGDVTLTREADGGFSVGVRPSLGEAPAEIGVDLEAVDLSELVRIELDLELLDLEGEEAGHLRLLVSDRHGQERYAHFPLEPGTTNYVIEERDLYGILLDEEHVKRIRLVFWRKPWFYKDKNLRAESCVLRVNAIRIVVGDAA